MHAEASISFGVFVKFFLRFHTHFGCFWCERARSVPSDKSEMIHLQIVFVSMHTAGTKGDIF